MSELQSAFHVKLEAKQRFFIQGAGTGNGIRFYDAVSDYGNLTTYNIVDWMADRCYEPEKINSKMIPYDRWNSITDNILYRPRRGKVIKEGGHFHRNSWREPEIQPKQCLSLSPFMDFMESAFGKGGAKYIISWIAWQYQKPLEKPPTALYIYGTQGCGKGTLAYILSKIFGNSALKIVADQSKFKSMNVVELLTCTLLVIDEIDIKIKGELANKLKSLISNSELSSDLKGKGFRNFEIPANIIMLSNNAPSHLEKDDRRYYVKHMESRDSSYFEGFYDYLNKGGLETIAHYLSNPLLIQDMKIGDRPPITEEKRLAMGMATKNDVIEVESFLEKNNEKLIFLPSHFKELIDANRIVHIADEVGLYVLDLRDIAQGKSAQLSCYTQAECKKLLVRKGYELFKDRQHFQTWAIRHKDSDTHESQKASTAALHNLNKAKF